MKLKQSTRPCFPLTLAVLLTEPHRKGGFGSVYQMQLVNRKKMILKTRQVQSGRSKRKKVCVIFSNLFPRSLTFYLLVSKVAGVFWPTFVCYSVHVFVFCRLKSLVSSPVLSPLLSVVVIPLNTC